jgi:ribonuclease P/MRP protein subunit RPP40
LNWLKDFICNRTFKVYFNDSLSTHISDPLTRGIPQGTILGPLMYNIYSRDLLDKFPQKDCFIKTYADDTKAYIIYKSLPQTNPLQSFTNHLFDWSTENGLRIATKKCVAMYIGNGNTENKYYIKDQEISKAQIPVRDLGLYITPKLNWSPHILRSCTKAYKRWFMFFKFFKTTNPKILVRLYKTYIRPVLEFGTQIFNSNIHKNCKKLEQVQHRITKMIIKRCFQNKSTQGAPYHERLALLDLQTLETRRLINDLVLFDKIHMNKINLNENNRPPLRTTSTRRSGSGYIYRQARTNLRKDSFFIRVPKLYQNLPKNLIPEKFGSEQFRKNLAKIDILEFASKTIHL